MFFPRVSYVILCTEVESLAPYLTDSTRTQSGGLREGDASLPPFYSAVLQRSVHGPQRPDLRGWSHVCGPMRHTAYGRLHALVEK